MKHARSITLLAFFALSFGLGGSIAPLAVQATPLQTEQVQVKVATTHHVYHHRHRRKKVVVVVPVPEVKIHTEHEVIIK